jgi:uncharacterized protein YbjT (DUF2867 family)
MKIFFRVMVLALVVAAAGCVTGPGGDADPLAGRTILVAGGSGRTGAFVVRRLKEQGHHVRAMTRNAAEARARLGADAEGVDWVEADVRDPAQVERAVDGVDYVISVIGSREMSGPNSAEFVDYGGVKNLVNASLNGHIRHFVLLTAIGSSDPESFANKMFKGALTWRFRGEEYLRGSGLSYTVVRPAGLTNEPAGVKGVRLYQGDDWKSHMGKTISRDDLALVMIAALGNPGARRATFEIANDPAEPPGTWPAQMAALRADPSLN